MGRGLVSRPSLGEVCVCDHVCLRACYADLGIFAPLGIFDLARGGGVCTNQSE